MTLRPWHVVLLAVAIVAAAFWGVHIVQQERDNRVLAELALAEVRGLNDSTRVRFAATAAAKDSLEAALTATKALNGKLLAALAIRVPERDTLILYDTLVTQAQDQWRTAQVRDSAFGVVMQANITAPPYPAPIGFSAAFTRRPFQPTVAFIQVGNTDSVVATVTWQNDSVEIVAPFVRRSARVRQRPRFVELNAYGAGAELRGGLQRSLLGLKFQAGVQQDIPWKDRIEPGRAFVGLRGEF